jgi:DNA-binding NarL/FixJ family response regulator
LSPRRILIADDHPLFRNGMRLLLETMPDLAVVGEATTGDETVSPATTLEPDIILMDLKMPGIGGIGRVERIEARNASGIRVDGQRANRSRAGKSIDLLDVGAYVRPRRWLRLHQRAAL